MAHYIDKDALMAEIENRIKELQNLHKENEEKFDSIQKTAILLCIDECKVVLNILINMLEIKDVDLEKEISFQWSKFCLNGKDRDSFVKVAKHFFELGLKAQKGE